jgi:sterol desaturase/sphingolipid hydroxylase (fatty acid hydroxylase superfamily)
MIPDIVLAGFAAALLIGLMALERHWPARRFPAVRGWSLMGSIFLAASLPIGGLTAFVLPLGWLGRHSLMTLEALPFALELLIGFLVSTFCYYWLHRAQHRFDWFWRSGHQLHHAIPRVDLAGTAFLHPTDLFLQIAVNIFACAFVLGLSPQATAAVSVFATVCGFFQHLNLRTPRWLALLVQRPEAHCVHHQIGLHAYNYADFPLWDRLFGTFRNPAEWSGEAGYGTEALHIADLLLMRDVSSKQPAIG